MRHIFSIPPRYHIRDCLSMDTHEKRSSAIFTEYDTQLSVSNNNQNKRKYKEENKKCRENRPRENKEILTKGTRSFLDQPVNAWVKCYVSFPVV